MGLGMFNALLTLLEQIIIPVYYANASSTDPDSNAAQNDSGMFGGLAIAGGVVGALIMGVVLDLTHKFGLLLKIGLSVSGCACVCVADELLIVGAAEHYFTLMSQKLLLLDVRRLVVCCHQSLGRTVNTTARQYDCRCHCVWGTRFFYDACPPLCPVDRR